MCVSNTHVAIFDVDRQKIGSFPLHRYNDVVSFNSIDCSTTWWKLTISMMIPFISSLNVAIDEDNAPPPPPIGPLLLPAPVIMAVLASFASALGQFDVLIAAMNAVPLNHSLLVPVPSGVVQRGYRGIPCCKTKGLTDVQLIMDMHCIWAGARCKGEYELSKITFTIAAAINDVVNCAARVMNLLHPGAQLWPGCGDVNTLFPDNQVLFLGPLHSPS